MATVDVPAPFKAPTLNPPLVRAPREAPVAGPLPGAAPIVVPAFYATLGGLRVHPVLVRLVEETVCPDTGFSPGYFWSCLGRLTAELRPEIEQALRRRDVFQAKIDAFYSQQLRSGMRPADAQHRAACTQLLREIGYLEPDKGSVSVSTQFVDPEIAKIPAPQLVVPSDNARYVLNAVNARWGSLYDALYGFDVIPETKLWRGAGDTPDAVGGYNQLRGEAVISFANGLLDEIAPLAAGKWSEVTRLWPKFIGASQQLELLLQSGATTSLRTPSLFVGSAGNLGPPDAHGSGGRVKPCVPDRGRIFLAHHGLHLILEVDRENPVGRSALSGIKDITMESALSAILDMEDSVAAVDAEDKARVYRNICGVLRGELSEELVKNGEAVTRRLREDIWLRDERGQAKTLPGRALCLVRNVGHHMYTDAVVTEDGRPIPEGFLDCLVTVAAALQDLKGTGQLCNSRTGSVYIVKPKMHGPEEVALTGRVFGRVEEFFGLRRNTIKMGIMDEERRTTVNLRECIRAASERVFFINTGFLDRTGDEIHSCMAAGPVVPKADIKLQPWFKAYEDFNVDVGLVAGLPGKCQIGKGMWAKPDSMKAMLESKISEPMSGGSTAWVPSPSAATLHSIHYHRVDVPARQMQLAMREPAHMDSILTPPLWATEASGEAIERELHENAHAILGYVVRWVDLGIGCSKVPDLEDVGLMEDRATLRISSQLMANWLLHRVITEQELREAFAEMARLVDQQNARDRAYRPMSGDLDTNIAFQAALKLVLDGRSAPNGYTEHTLHEARRRVKALVQARL